MNIVTFKFRNLLPVAKHDDPVTVADNFIQFT
jgi:hypothetical protein